MKESVIAFAIAAMSTVAFAGSGLDQLGHRHRGEGHFQKFAQLLNLTDIQKQQIRDIRRSNGEKNQQLYSEFRAKREELRDLEQANDPRAGEARIELQRLAEQVHAAHQATRDAILSVLTPEQQSKFRELRPERRYR